MGVNSWSTPSNSANTTKTSKGINSWSTPPSDVNPAKVLKGVTPLYTKNQQIASPVSADLKSGTNSVGKRKMSAGLNYYVNGSPIPSKNPAPGVAGVNKAAEDYAKKATAGDGFESLSLDELKLKTEKAKKDYENGFKGENIIQTGLNLLGGNNAYKHEYEKLREAYNNRINAFNEYNRNIALQKGEKTYDEKEYDIKSKGTLGKTVDVLEHIDNTVSAGGNMFRQSANATMNATLGNLAKAFGFKDNIFQQGYDYATYANNKANEKMELSAKQLGDKNNISGTLGANIVNMIPDIILAYASGGASTLEAAAKANLGLGTKSASLLTATQRGIKELAKNPIFFTSFAGEVGNDYYEAMANGATESQAMLAALTASTVNAAIEVGGVQELPSKLLENKSLGKKTLDWVLSSLSEGKEEVLQDFISQLSAKAIYDKDKEVFSLSDQGAIINPERMANEFGLGVAAGGLMGGGMLTFNSIVNSKTKAEYKRIGETARKLGDVDGLINYAQHSIDTDIRTLAYNTDSESISDLVLGQLYAYACRDIDGAINSPKELNIAIDNFNEIASSTDSKLINGIASSRIIERLTSAGIDSESAKYMAESAKQTDTVNSVNETSDLQSTAEADNSDNAVFHEPDSRDIAEKLDPYDKYKTKENGYQVKDSRQRHIERITNKLGAKITWSEDVKRGKYIPSERRIVLNPNMKTSEMYNFVFKHEFTHYLEGKKGYTDFKNYVFEKSALFEKWARERLAKNGIDSTGSREEVIKRLTQVQYEAYRNSDELSKVMRDRFTMNDAEAEVLADFVGENLLGTGDRLEQTLYELGTLEKKHRGIIQRIRDFISDLIARYRNEKRFGGLVKDLEYLNDRLKRVAESSDKKNSDNETEKYSIAGERAVTADKSLLETAKQRIENGEDSETVRRETGWFKGYDGKWRFEINDKMSELVENPKLETHGNDEDGLYQTARLADVLKHDDLFKAYPELKDYKVIIQETNAGVEGSFFPKRKEIVLSRNLFERITKEYYDYLNGGRKAEIAKIEQTPEYKEYSKFYDNPELANIDPEEWLKLEEEARDKFFSSELGKRYYQLNWGKVDIRKYEPGWSKGAKAVLFHEIQHAIQNIEGFASGSNQRYWNEKIQRGFEVRKNDKRIQNAEKEYRKIFDSAPKDFKEKIREMNRATIAQDYDTVMRIQDELYESEYADLFSQLDMADFVRRSDRGEVLTADDLYENTAGEIESRDVEKRLNYSAEQRKNTRPDIDRTDVVFADGSVSSFLSKGNKSDSKRLIQLIQENINEIPKNNLYDISGDGIIDGVKSRYILDIFDMQGNTAYRKDLGTIELTESGAESTIFHGFGKNKLIAAKGIKNVIENGKIISKIENYQNKGNTRYVIAGYGTINNLDSIMAVAINEYVAENGRKSFYLHEIVIKNKDASPFMAEQQKTVSAGKASSDITVPQKAQSVNTSISENSENDTEKNSIAVLPADELLDKYDRGEITREEYLKQTDSMTRRAALQYVQKWEQENGAILKNQRRLDEEREKAVELEREEQQMRKDRENNIGAIRRTVRKLDHALRANTNSKHIPEAYKNVVANFCKLFADNDQATFEHKELADIYSYYSSLKGDENNADAPQYDPYIDELLKSLVDTLSGKKLTELNSLELNQVRTITDALNYTVDHEAQVFIDGKKAKYEEVGRAALNDIESAEPVKLFGALKKESAEKIREFFYEGNMLPEYFLKRMGGTFEKAFKGLADGQNKWARNMEISRKFVEDVKSKYDYDEWKDTTVSFRTESGANVEITIDQAMQLVATAQRERSNNGQRAKHLSIGGVVIDTEAINKAMKKQGKSKGDISAAWDSLSNRAIQITFEDVDVVSKMLTDAQKGYIKDFVDFLSTQCAVWGNEVTMEQYGYRQFNESNYFPYVSSELFLTKDPAKAESTILRRASFTHSLQKNANNPLVLTSFTDIALQHMESMCNFNAMTVPLETLNKIFNYKTESGEGTAPRSVKAEMKNVFGSGAVDYMQNLIKDLNTGVRGDQRDSFLNKMTSLFKKNAVLANLSVIFQQPTAIIRAGSDMKGKYFTNAAKYYSKNNYEECKQYAPVAVIKQMGRFDTGVGVKNTTWLSGEQTFREKADDFLGWGAGKADEIAWSYLWSAVKAEIADTTDLKVGGEEFLIKAGERFTELVNKTQVYDSVLTKSQNMRNKGLVGSITSFMSEPTVALNMVVNSFLDFKEGKTSGKKFSRIVMSVATAEIVTAVMQSFITAARDDDEDKSYLEKYLKNVVSNSLSNFNLAGKIPYIRDIMSLWEGYDIERQDISAVSDLIEAFQTLTNENKTVPEKIRRISEALAALFGVPLKNIDRDIAAIAKTIYGFAFGKEKTDAEGLKISALEGVSENNILKPFGIEFFNFSKTGEYERMAEAAKCGDEKTYSESYNRLIENGTEDSDIRTGITKQFKNDKTVKKQSEQYVKELKQNDTFNSFTDEDKEKLTGQVSSALAKEAMFKATEREPDEYDRLYKLYRTNKSGYNKRKKEMLAEGKTEKQINDGLELAKYAYLQSKGIDLHEYLLYKMATSEKYADEDDSGGVSKAEKKKAVDNMDVDEKTRKQIRSYLINGN